MTKKQRSKGPWTHRLMVLLFCIAQGILCFWLLGFVVDDIGNWPGPNYDDMEQKMLDASVVARRADLDDQIEEVQRTISRQTEQQSLLRDSTANSQRTMDQLLQFQRLSLQKNVKPSAEEQQALAESQKRFLKNQRQYQGLTEKKSAQHEQLLLLQGELRAVDERLEELSEPIRAEFRQLSDAHEFKTAAIKIGSLLPLLLAGVVMFVKLRGGTYAPLMYAFNIALLLKVALVMHEYFPSQYFKYVLILAALAIVVGILVSLLRMLAFPKRDWLLKQYQEAYEVFLCPICSYPIRRGPLKYRFWNRRSIKKMAAHVESNGHAEHPYCCPKCSTQLFEKCNNCEEVRHSLLPTCDQCGDTKALELEAAS